MAVRQGLIVYVGDEFVLEPFVGPSTHDRSRGRMLFPGFHDSHVHIVDGGLNLAGCDLSTDATAEAIAVHIACASENERAPWVIGRGWQLGVFPGANPTRRQLDAVVTD